METIHRQTHQMHRLVDDLTEAARWAVGRDAAAARAFRSLRPCHRRGAGRHRRRGPPGATSCWSFRRSSPFWVDADRQRLQQVMSNLLGNAIKYTDAGGCITVTMARLAETVTVSISDTGRGLAPQALTHIFDHVSRRYCPLKAPDSASGSASPAISSAGITG
jgi:two-component system CheB/CheR fusion protein